MTTGAAPAPTPSATRATTSWASRSTAESRVSVARMTLIDRHEPGSWSWVDLSTDDPEKARRYYAGLFDWTYEIGGPETGGYALAFRDGKRVAGIGGKPPGMPMPSAWTPYLSTDDLDATLAAVKGAGG